MSLAIRPATLSDLPFLSWVMYRAAQSHLDTCPWRRILDADEAETRAFLEDVAQSDTAHWCHLSKFRIAEIDGTAAAAMAGFRPRTEGTAVLAETVLNIAAARPDVPPARLERIAGRLGIAALGLPEDQPGTWGIENVAVLPEYRGKGLIDALFAHVLDEGRQQGFRRAQILCLIGNTRGQTAWERNGFAVHSERTSPEFEALIGTPGAKLMLRDL